MRYLGFVVLLLSAGPALANNNIPPATILVGNSGSLDGTNTGATAQGSENATYGGGAIESMWYSWTATANGVFTASTCNLTTDVFTSFDTTLIAYTGNAFPRAVVSTNDDATGCAITGFANRGSVVTFNVVAGTTYHLQVDGYAGADGNFNLHWGFAALVVTPVVATATEGGATGSFTVRLAGPPAATPPGGDNMPAQSANVTITAGAQCTYAPSPLTFTSANWSVPQTVTVTAINDTNVEGTHSCTPASITAANGAYAGITVPGGSLPTTTITDNDIASLVIAKTWAFAPGGDLDGDTEVDKGDIIRFSFQTTNNGTVPMSNVVVNETAFDGTGGTPVPSSEALTDNAPLSDSSDATANNGTWTLLAPGDVVTMTANYTVTQIDIDNQ